MIEVRELTKTYGSLTAVDQLSFEVGRGETFGLLGPNGAGKTTTIRMLVGALHPDGGSIHFDGESDPTRASLKRQVGLAPQELAIYETMTAEENLRFFGRLYGLRGAALRDRIARCLELVGLEDRGSRQAHTYSGGMKRRLNLACALIHEPRVLFLDEPTAGVDPQSRNRILENIEGLCHRGMTVVYTTHYMEEAQRLCDRVGIMDHGKLLALDAVPALIEQHGGGSVVKAELTGPIRIPLPGELDGNRLRVETNRPLEVVAELGKAGVGIAGLHVDRPDLERVFLHLTGRSLRD